MNLAYEPQNTCAVLEYVDFFSLVQGVCVWDPYASIEINAREAGTKCEGKLHHLRRTYQGLEFLCFGSPNLQA